MQVDLQQLTENALLNQNAQPINSHTILLVLLHAQAELILAMEDVLEAAQPDHSISEDGVMILAQLKPNTSLIMLV